MIEVRCQDKLTHKTDRQENNHYNLTSSRFVQSSSYKITDKFTVILVWKCAVDWVKLSLLLEFDTLVEVDWFKIGYCWKVKIFFMRVK